MERLTARNDGNPYYPRCFELPCEGLLCEREECDLGDKIIDRLAAYEDTGFTPEDIKVMHNELCLQCGNYKRAHLGACSGCRWRKEPDNGT